MDKWFREFLEREKWVTIRSIDIIEELIENLDKWDQAYHVPYGDLLEITSCLKGYVWNLNDKLGLDMKDGLEVSE